MAMPAAEIEALIVAALPGAAITITDLAGDGDHYAAHVEAPQFKGLSRIAQHKAVYAALGAKMGGNMGGALHALQLTTAAPTS